MMLSAYDFRQFARSRHAGVPNNVVVPGWEFLQPASKSDAVAMPVLRKLWLMAEREIRKPCAKNAVAQWQCA
jgi:hypothetical protein